MNIVIAAVISSFAILFPLTVGGLISEKSGYLSIGLEGYLNLGAFLYFLFNTTMPALYAFVFSTLLLIVFALVFDSYSILFSVDHFIVGLAINLLVSGLIPIFSEHAFNTKGPVFRGEIISRYVFQFISNDSVYGGVRITDIAAIVAGIAGLIFLTKVPAGMHISVMGTNSRALEIAGISSNLTRLIATTATVFLASCSGIAMIGSLGAWVPNMSSGKGWIALVLVYLGQKSVIGILGSCILFCLFQALTIGMQKYSMLMTEFLMAVPYITITVFILIFSLRKRT